MCIRDRICWFSEKPLSSRGKFILRHTTKDTKVVIRDIKYKVDINTLHKIEDDLEFRLNDIGRISLRTAAPLCYDPYKMNRSTGSFILVDPFTNETMGLSLIHI